MNYFRAEPDYKQGAASLQVLSPSIRLFLHLSVPKRGLVYPSCLTWEGVACSSVISLFHKGSAVDQFVYITVQSSLSYRLCDPCVKAEVYSGR